MVNFMYVRVSGDELYPFLNWRDAQSYVFGLVFGLIVSATLVLFWAISTHWFSKWKDDTRIELVSETEGAETAKGYNTFRGTDL